MKKIDKNLLWAIALLAVISVFADTVPFRFFKTSIFNQSKILQAQTNLPQVPRDIYNRIVRPVAVPCDKFESNPFIYQSPPQREDYKMLEWLRITTAHPLRLKITDANDKPISGATIGVQVYKGGAPADWRDDFILTTQGKAISSLNGYSICSVKTDANGEVTFVIRSTPNIVAADIAVSAPNLPSPWKFRFRGCSTGLLFARPVFPLLETPDYSDCVQEFNYYEEEFERIADPSDLREHFKIWPSFSASYANRVLNTAYKEYKLGLRCSQFVSSPLINKIVKGYSLLCRAERNEHPWQRPDLLKVGPEHLTSLTITKTGSGANSGKVTSEPAGINCGSTCQAHFKEGTIVTLKATPYSAASQVSWSGQHLDPSSCQPNSLTCRVNIGQDPISVEVNFSGNTVIVFVQTLFSIHPHRDFFYLRKIKDANVKIVANGKTLIEETTDKNGEVVLVFERDPALTEAEIIVTKTGFKEERRPIYFDNRSTDSKIIKALNKTIYLEPSQEATAVSGSVKYLFNKNFLPLDNALVTITVDKNPPISAKTSPSGFYYLNFNDFAQPDKISAKTALLKIEAPGFETFKKSINLPATGGLIKLPDIVVKQKQNTFSQVLEFRDIKEKWLVIGPKIEVVVRAYDNLNYIFKGETYTGRITITGIPHEGIYLVQLFAEDYNVSSFPISFPFGGSNLGKVLVVELESEKLDCINRPLSELCFDGKSSIAVRDFYNNQVGNILWDALSETFFSIKNKLNLHLPNKIYITDRASYKNAHADGYKVIIHPSLLKEIFPLGQPNIYSKTAKDLFGHELAHIYDFSKNFVSLRNPFVDYWIAMTDRTFRLLTESTYSGFGGHPEDHPIELWASAVDIVFNFHQKFHETVTAERENLIKEIENNSNLSQEQKDYKKKIVEEEYTRPIKVDDYAHKETGLLGQIKDFQKLVTAFKKLLLATASPVNEKGKKTDEKKIKPIDTPISQENFSNIPMIGQVLIDGFVPLVYGQIVITDGLNHSYARTDTNGYFYAHLREKTPMSASLYVFDEQGRQLQVIEPDHAIPVVAGKKLFFDVIVSYPQNNISPLSVQP